MLRLKELHAMHRLRSIVSYVEQGYVLDTSLSVENATIRCVISVGQRKARICVQPANCPQLDELFSVGAIFFGSSFFILKTAIA